MHIVVEQKHVLEFPVLDKSQVLDVETVLCGEAVASREEVCYVLTFWVKSLDDEASIGLCRCCVNYDFEILGDLDQELLPVGTCTEPQLSQGLVYLLPI